MVLKLVAEPVPVPPKAEPRLLPVALLSPGDELEVALRELRLVAGVVPALVVVPGVFPIDGDVVVVDGVGVPTALVVVGEVTMPVTVPERDAPAVGVTLAPAAPVVPTVPGAGTIDGALTTEFAAPTAVPGAG